jgi:putative solute:sodium symporter small subunit
MTVDDRSQSAQRRYWRRNLRLIGVLLLIWSVVSFVLVWYARELSFDFFGWPFSFYMAAQGSLLVYLVLVVVYARLMNRLDRDIEVHQDAP